MFIEQYSGPESRKFWNAINNAPNVGVDLYLLGCVLQDIEGRVLQLLNKEPKWCISSTRNKKKKKKKVVMREKYEKKF